MMQDENPYKPGEADDDAPTSPQSEGVSAGRATYNVVSDTVTGLNARKSDNLFQAIFILVSVLVCAAIGAPLAMVYREHFALGLVGGAFAGLIVGVFGSGIFLMVYRAVRHAKGKHD